MNFLKGHPLSLQLALPQLRDYSAEQLVEQYQTILPSIKVGEARERNESLEVSLRFSLDRLGEEVKTLLTRLAVFEGGALETALLAVTEIPEAEWNAIKPQLTSTALIRLEELAGVTVPFVHFHPTLVPHLRALPESQTNYQLLITKYWQVYYSLANQLYDDDTQHPIQARSIVLRELPNLKRALKLTLAAGALDEAVDFAARLNHFLDKFGRWRERDEVVAVVEKVISDQSSVGRGKMTKREYMMEYGRGERLLQQGRAGEAEQVFRALLERLEVEADYDTCYDQTLVLGYLGRCLREQGHPSQATGYYHRAIALAEKLDQTENIQKLISTVHTDLADVFVDMGQYESAKHEYLKSIAVDKKTGEEGNASATLGQLGTLALKQGNLNEARKRYIEALEICQRSGEKQGQAIFLHMLGRVAESESNWDEAENHHKQGMKIEENLNDLVGVAKSRNQLAIVAMNAGRPQEAERWYLQAIELFEKIGQTRYLASTSSNLAGIYLAQNRLDEAETYAHRALTIKETLDLSSEPWRTYGILAEIAEKRGRIDEVREWRHKEQETYKAFAGSDYQMGQLESLIGAVVAACQGNQEAISALNGLVKQLRSNPQLSNFANAIEKIINGERDIKALGTGGRETVFVERILQALSGEGGVGNPHPPTPSPIAKEQAIGEGEQPSPRPSPTGRGSRAPSPKVGRGQGEGGQAPSPKVGRGQGESGVTLPQLLDLIERAAGGDQQLGGQLFGAFQQMSRAEDATMSALGNVLLRVLVGEREPDLSKLPDELASAVRGLVGRLKNK